MKKSLKKKASGLRRYTNVPALLHILQNRKLTLLSPATWDDKNDAFFMSQFKRRQKLESVLALCFAKAPETYHHWRVFTHGSDGACITFRREELVAKLSCNAGIIAQSVKYKLIRELNAFSPAVKDLPFLKRQPYKDEKEFRILYIDAKERFEAKEFDIDLTSIERVTLSPWMPKSLANAVRQTIHAIPGCDKIKVYQTTLLENDKWKSSARGAH
ncbi:MAG: hypothetical protein JWO28_759 [Hyphomicrobiales bacterium]|nr:hypothetical protein [Hyphomicrobiales bacterium]